MATKTSKDIRSESRFMVLRTVYARGTVTRAQVSAETGLSPATVTKLMDRGSTQTVGIVSDAEPFLRALATELEKLQ